jgi:hypothetical protein
MIIFHKKEIAETSPVKTGKVGIFFTPDEKFYFKNDQQVTTEFTTVQEPTYYTPELIIGFFFGDGNVRDSVTIFNDQEVTLSAVYLLLEMAVKYVIIKNGK